MDFLSLSTSSSSSSHSSSSRSSSSGSDNISGSDNSSGSDDSSDSYNSSGGDNNSDSVSSDEDNGEVRSSYYDVKEDKDLFGSKSKDKTHIAPVPDASNAKQDRRINNKYRASIIAEQMDVVHDRASIIEEEEDRISNLPNEIFHHILSFLDMKYVVQISTLSKKWKNIWTSMPHLNLNSRSFRTSPKFAKFVNDVLSHRNHRAEVSAVELSFRGAATQFDADVRSIVNYAYSHNVRKLSLVWFRFNNEVLKFPPRLFRSYTLKHLTLATNHLSGCGLSVPKSAWDFPALETLNLSNMKFGGYGDNTNLNLFSKCVNLKDITLHGYDMWGLDIFNVCAQQLSNLTIIDPYRFPKVFNVVAPKLESLTASVMDISSNFLQLSTEDLNSLEKVNLSMQKYISRKERYAPGLQDLFQKLCSAKFLILDNGIIELLSTCLDQLSDEPCPFNNLKCLKQKDRTPRMHTQVRNYLLESSPTATFIMDLPQKRSREDVDKGTMAKKASNVFVLKARQKISREEVDKGTTAEKVPHKRSRQEAENGTMANTLEEKVKHQAEIVDEEKTMLEAKLFKQDEVIAEKKAMLEAMKVQHEKIMLEAKIQEKVIEEQKVMLETMKLQNEKKMFEAKIQRQDKIIAEQKAMLEAMKLQHEKIETELGNIDN